VSAVLVDTSVWRHFFGGTAGARSTALLGELLDADDAVLCHPAVIGELVLGGLSQREEALLARLPQAPELSNADVLAFVRLRKLPRKGIGWLDCHLLASTLVARAALWSLDKKLAVAAASIDAAFDTRA
jgi:predicted nucleic acid-binding protein